MAFTVSLVTTGSEGGLIPKYASLFLLRFALVENGEKNGGTVFAHCVVCRHAIRVVEHLHRCSTPAYDTSLATRHIPKFVTNRAHKENRPVKKLHLVPLLLLDVIQSPRRPFRRFKLRFLPDDFVRRSFKHCVQRFDLPHVPQAEVLRGSAGGEEIGDRRIEAAGEHAAQVHVPLRHRLHGVRAGPPEPHEPVLAGAGDQLRGGGVDGERGAGALVQHLLELRSAGLSHVVVEDLSSLRGHVEAVGSRGVPDGALRLAGDADPGAVAGRSAVGDGADAVEGGGEEDVGLDGVELDDGHLVLVVVQSEHAVLGGDVPQLHGGVRAAGGEHVAVLRVPRQPHHRLPMAPRTQRAPLPLHQAPQHALRLQRVDHVRAPHLDLRVERAYGDETPCGCG